MFIFYNWPEEAEDVNISITRFHCRVRRVIKIEKKIAFSVHCTNDSQEKFIQKWEDFSEVYQIHGPDTYEV